MGTFAYLAAYHRTRALNGAGRVETGLAVPRFIADVVPTALGATVAGLWRLRPAVGVSTTIVSDRQGARTVAIYR